MCETRGHSQGLLMQNIAILGRLLSAEAALPLLQILPSKSHHAVAPGNFLLCLRTSLVLNSTQARFQTGAVPISDTSVASQHQHHFEIVQKLLAVNTILAGSLLPKMHVLKKLLFPSHLVKSGSIPSG